MMRPDILDCPQCHKENIFNNEDNTCNECGFTGIVNGQVFSTLTSSNSYFDDLHPVMVENNEKDTVYKLCYERQNAKIEKIVKPGMVVLDVGCGPDVGYNLPEGAYLIGVEPSLPSLISNKKVDLHLHSSATNLPLKENSVDVVMCFYSVHHMIGKTKAETIKNVESAFKEFSRIIKPGGNILIFEVNPWWPFFQMEKLGWNTAKKILKSKCDLIDTAREQFKPCHGRATS